MLYLYMGAMAFGATLLLASVLFAGKDTDQDGSFEGDIATWAPVTSMRFWVFLLAFGGGAGVALTKLGSSALVAGVGALGVGWAAGAGATLAVRYIKRNSVSSEVASQDLIGATGTLVLPIAPGQPGKVRVDIKGRTEDFVATSVDPEVALPSGAPVLVVSEGDSGTLLVTKSSP
ncbi:MAG: hypothetical protein R3B48_13945 [Kofleriaceae bacterium]